MSADRYEFHVRGRIDPADLERFEGLEQEVCAAVTTLRGPVDDQAALFGLLERVRALGLELVEVRPLDGDAAPSTWDEARSPGRA
jgi:hypothetical protein